MSLKRESGIYKVHIKGWNPYGAYEYEYWTVAEYEGGYWYFMGTEIEYSSEAEAKIVEVGERINLPIIVKSDGQSK